MTADFDAIVIGAGVIGLAIARNLAMSGQQVLVLETASRAGTETSARNSEVIHAGLYYPTNSLKARFCVEGRQQLYAFCEEHGVATRRLGKLIVATSEIEEIKLQSIQAQAKANGVHDLEWLTASQASSLEPEIKCTAALLSPSTGILDVQGYILALLASAEDYGTTLAFQTSFVNAQIRDGLFGVSMQGAGGETSQLKCRTLINCAGHGAHAVAAAIVVVPLCLTEARHPSAKTPADCSAGAPGSRLTCRSDPGHVISLTGASIFLSSGLTAGATAAGAAIGLTSTFGAPTPIGWVSGAVPAAFGASVFVASAFGATAAAAGTDGTVPVAGVVTFVLRLCQSRAWSERQRALLPSSVRRSSAFRPSRPEQTVSSAQQQASSPSELRS